MSKRVTGFSIERRYVNEGTDSDALPSAPRPLSLQMGEDVIFAFACGDEEAKALVAGWEPTFRWR